MGDKMAEKIFENAKWIWNAEKFGENEYCEICEKVNYSGGKTLIRLSVCGEYTLYVNGKYVSSNQYADFEHYKVYDEIDITDVLNDGENFVCILAWYWARSGMRFFTPTPGIVFEIENDGKIISKSDKNTLSRESCAYTNGSELKISTQLGYSFEYDANKEDEWLFGKGNGFSESYEYDKKVSLYKRPIKKHNVLPVVKAERTEEKNAYIFDLGREITGYCSFCIKSEKAQNIKVCYGELLKDGHVKKVIGNRHFWFEYKTKKGDNSFTNYMLRLACRYIEIECEEPIDVQFVGICPQMYPVLAKETPKVLDDVESKIYDTCLYTLYMCMLEHYVDCPWREQCLYTFDSRNQMLCGYYAFEDSNFEYARANLLLMSKDNRKDGYMSICFPSDENLTIPSFCLYYILAVKEYTEYSKDLTLAGEVFDKMESVLDVFMKGRRNGLIYRAEGEAYWNFYDWSDYCVGTLFEKDESVPDFMINAIALYALESFDKICKTIGRENKFSSCVKELYEKVNERFFDKEEGLYHIITPDEKPTELANAFAVLTGLASGKTAEKICEKLAQMSLCECSLSMKPFKYDALLKIDREKYSPVILDEIRRTYKAMLDEGATTVWETAKGESDFETAASLCHGWSSMPIYYYSILKNS